MTLVSLTPNSFASNCYLAIQDGHAYVIDPSASVERILRALQENEVECDGILLTHGHFDHIGGVNLVKEKTGAKIVAHKDEEEMLIDSGKNEFRANNGYDMEPVIADIFVEDGSKLDFGDKKIHVLHTPGHTKGGVCYIFEDDRIMFSGDTLFRLTAGRADLYGGDARTELMSLAKIGELEGDYKVYPGHDDATTLDFERQYNRYMRTRFRRK